MLLFIFFNDTATTEIYTLSLHDALPICETMEQMSASRSALGVSRIRAAMASARSWVFGMVWLLHDEAYPRGNAADRKSTRLNSSHANISYAVFCLKKKNTNSPSMRVPNP